MGWDGGIGCGGTLLEIGLVSVDSWHINVPLTWEESALLWDRVFDLCQA